MRLCQMHGEGSLQLREGFDERPRELAYTLNR